MSNGVPSEKADVADLIARHGESAATAWLEPRYDIWRGSSHSEESPAVQGYMESDGYAIAWGNPLCKNNKDLERVVKEFIHFTEEKNLYPFWCCVDEELEHVLAHLGWAALTCIKEDVLHPDEVKLNSKDLKHNVRRAKRDGVKVTEETGAELSEEVKKEIEAGIEQWKSERSGIQIASATLQPWLDQEHRRYWLARVEDKVVGICILAELKDDSYQIKNALQFPGSPKGTSEYLIASVIETLRDEGKHAVTFGTSAADELQPVENMGGWKITWLSKAYSAIVRATGLTKRGNFRRKFGVEEELLYVCYPPDKFGWMGIAALMRMLSKTK